MRTMLFIWMSVGASCALMAGSPRSASAGSFESAQSGLSKAYNDYYEALRKSPNPSKDAAALSKQILDPARKTMRQAMRSQAAETARRVRADKRNAMKLSTQLPPDGKATDPADARPATPRAAQAPVQSERPKTVLDGSRVPRELEFGGPKKSEP
jgi:hypothetical protein